MALRDYQENSVTEIRNSLRKYHHVIYQLPTGGGKGVVLGSIASMGVHKGTRVLILGHSEEIVKQNASHALRWGAVTAIVTSRVKKAPTGSCVSMMAQTLQQRIKKDGWRDWLNSFQMIILDECHRAEFNFIFDVIGPTVYVIGFSASPSRYGSQRQLGLDYEAIVTGPSVQRLIDLGWLCRCRLFSLDAPKLDGVEWSAQRGDYNLGQMAAKFKSEAKYVGAVENYERICKGEKCLIFCCSSEQTIGITKEFHAHGIDARYCLSGSFDEDEDYSGERKDIVNAFRNNEFPVLVNYGLFTTGIDIPDIKVVMLMFSTTSLVKYLQCLGRASRPAPGKDGTFICLDFGGNYERLGRYEDDREWSVWHKPTAGGGVAPVKECPVCHRLIAVQYSECPFCGYHFPTRHEVYKADLEEILAKEDKKENETIAGYVARMKLAGKNSNWILVNICIRNADEQKKSFMEAIKYLKRDDGTAYSPQFWYFFKLHVLSKVAVKPTKEKPLLFK